jgi:hypothetical protein
MFLDALPGPDELAFPFSGPLVVPFGPVAQVAHEFLVAKTSHADTWTICAVLRIRKFDLDFHG